VGKDGTAAAVTQVKKAAPSEKMGIVEDTTDENGVRTTVEYVLNDDGKKVKVRTLPSSSTAFS
jgi:hypothetical protein